MNLKYNKVIRNSLSRVSAIFRNLKNSILSIGYILALSSLHVARTSRKIKTLKQNAECCILGNGPSLKQALDNEEIEWKYKDVMCVNMFCQTTEFWTIKPRFYYIADPAYFLPKTDRHRNMISLLVESFRKVDWDMFVFMGPHTPKCDLVNALKTNCHVQIVKINVAQVSGFIWFRHFIYKHRLGMPRCQTIINMALTNAINMKYEAIYLYGADHSWTKDLRVNVKNEVCYGDRHVYNTGLSVVKKDCNMATILIAFSNMFSSHYLIEEYAKKRKVKIWNCTQESFIDAYERYSYS